MKYIIRLYRMFKPVCVCTSYLFSAMTVLCLLVHELSGGRFFITAELLWGLLVLSLGSIGIQRFCLETERLRLSYPVRLVLYICGVALWGLLCMKFFAGNFSGSLGGKVFFWPVGLGVLCCAGLEVFSRCRARVYNTLLLQYKKRKR